jgi:hypothetical protein
MSIAKKCEKGKILQENQGFENFYAPGTILFEK